MKQTDKKITIKIEVPEEIQAEIQTFLSHMADLGLDTQAVIEAIQKVEGEKDE